MSKIPSSPATVGAPVMGYDEDRDGFLMPHIAVTENTKTGEKIARTTIAGKTYEARHPYDGGRAAEVVRQELEHRHQRGELATGII